MLQLYFYSKILAFTLTILQISQVFFFYTVYLFWYIKKYGSVFFAKLSNTLF